MFKQQEQWQGLIFSVAFHLALVALLFLSTYQLDVPVSKGVTIQAEIMDLEDFLKKQKTANKPKAAKKEAVKKIEKTEPEQVKTTPPKETSYQKKIKEKREKEKQDLLKQKEKETRDKQKTEREERQKKLEEIRKKRQEAEAFRKEQQKKLENLEKTKAAPEEQQTKPFGTSNGKDEKNKLLGQYKSSIKLKVKRQWSRPPTAKKGLHCQVIVNQIPGGGIIEVSIGNPCNADTVVKNSIINAVKKAEPLPYTGFESVFEREINFYFEYDGE